jgi:hypothetical protein
MGFNGVIPSNGVPFNISPGHSTRVWISQDGEDQGAQWIMASPIGMGSLASDSQTKTVTYPPDYGGAADEYNQPLYVTYWCTVYCYSGAPDSCAFGLDGGGNT